MKSVVVERPGRLAIHERALADPGPGEVRVRIFHAGICGSDLHIFHGSNPFAEYPRVIGHEFVGRVDAVGAGVDLEPGARVVIDPVVACGHCYPCSVGRPNVCASLQVIGVHRDGGFAEYACVPAGNAYPVPDAIDDERAAMVEPFSVAANITDHTGAFARDVALLYGAGPIGLMVAQVLKWVHGVGTLIVTDRIDERLVLARANGADHALNTGREPLPAALDRLGMRPTLVIDAACHPAILAEAITLAAPAGRIGIMGFSTDPSTIVQQAVTAKELSIHSSRLNGRKFPKVLGWMEQGLIHPDRLITHRFPFTEIETAMDVFAHHPAECCKVLLSF